MKIVFEPNPVKDALNLQTHGISFATAEEAFGDPNHVMTENYFYSEDGEQRYQIIGMTNNLMLLMVVYVDRSQAERIVLRIISARKANKFEENIYAAHIEN